MNTRLSSFEGFPFFPPSVTLSFAVPVQVFFVHIWPLLPLFFFFFFSATDCGYGNSETNRILLLLCQAL